MEEKGGTEATPLVATQPRNRSYVSWFDVIAGPGAAFLMLLTVTSLVPTAEHTAHHAAHGGTKAAAQQSGILLGVVALGICLSNAGKVNGSLPELVTSPKSTSARATPPMSPGSIVTVFCKCTGRSQ